MERKTVFCFGLVSYLILFYAFASTGFAMTDRPPQPAGENQGLDAPNREFQEGDAIRYGGLFGPLPDPFEDRPFDVRPLFGGPQPADGENLIPQSRDMGFGAGAPGFDPINKGPRCPEGALSCPG